MSSESRPNREVLAELLLRWEELYERGQDTPASELAIDHPDLIPELARRIAALKTVSWITRPTVLTPQEQAPKPAGLAGKTLGGRYRLDELIAEGGFAEVYRAYDTELQRTVAVKIPKRSRLQSTESFLGEARRVARLKHDGIVAVHDVGVEGDACFIVSEFLDGGSLADRLSGRKPTKEEAIRWVCEVAEALEYAHKQEIVHRDVKPANILIDQHGRAKLADFGIALSSVKTEEVAPSLGTLRYMSPEQLEGQPADPRSDIFSLGLVLYETLSGQLPYSSTEASSIRREIMDGKIGISSSLPGPLFNFIRKATNRSPHLRHASAAEFSGALGRATRRPPWFLTRLGLAGAGIGLSLILLHPFLQQGRGKVEQGADPPTRQPQATPRPTDQISVSGIGVENHLTGSIPAPWIQQGVFAEIATAGTAEFPSVAESAYVMEADVVFKSPRGRLALHLGEPNCNCFLSMGDYWAQDTKQDKVAVRLFRAQPFGVNWIGETFFETNQPLSLMLVVADDNWVLLRNGQAVLHHPGDPADFRLRLVASGEAQVTLRRLSCRALTEEDCRRVNVEFPRRSIPCDTDATRDRLRSRITDEWLREPVTEKDFALADDFVMRWIAPAEFTMGLATTPSLQMGGGEERVKITRGYWIGAYETTQGQWQAVMGDNPSRIKGSPYLPINYVSWSDARRFCTRLTAKERERDRVPDGYEYRLPTEAEWEYACRAGTDTEYVVPFSELVYRGEKYPHIVEVGATLPNPWGLYEVLGNVAEWCLDEWRRYPKDSGIPTVDRFHEGDPTRAGFVVRGSGFWNSEVEPTLFARTARHDVRGGFRGFRVVLAPTINLRYGKSDAD